MASQSIGTRPAQFTRRQAATNANSTTPSAIQGSTSSAARWPRNDDDAVQSLIALGSMSVEPAAEVGSSTGDIATEPPQEAGPAADLPRRIVDPEMKLAVAQAWLAQRRANALEHKSLIDVAISMQDTHPRTTWLRLLSSWRGVDGELSPGLLEHLAEKAEVSRIARQRKARDEEKRLETARAKEQRERIAAERGSENH